jgi:SAM-dependent MidA family methyltransferase
MSPPPQAEAVALAELRRRLTDELAANGGAISFARFMERALYEPDLGYYERGAPVVGKRGDFYTSVSVGPLFGELLAFQFSRWFDAARSADGTVHRLELIEAGAHDGRLAADILNWFRRWRPEVAAHLRLTLLEPSATRRGWQQETLASFKESVTWLSSPDDLAPTQPDTVRIIYSNELLDAFPAHRLVWDATAHRWGEQGVSLDNGRFVWRRLPEPSAVVRSRCAELDQLPKALLDVLPDGFTTECQPAAQEWWRTAASRLGRGWLLTFDYGLAAEELLLPHRASGTLRAYRDHRHADDVLNAPGSQDLTVHVNFTALQTAGEEAGLQTVARTTQCRFLTDLLAATQTAPGSFPAWESARLRQFQTLTHPEHLGRSFSVLVQRRAVSNEAGGKNLYPCTEDLRP